MNSLGYWSDIAVLGERAEVTERDEYWVVRTPGEPGFFWGNFLLFREAPTPDCRSAWEAAYAREFADPAYRHRAFGWDSPGGDTSAFSDYQVVRLSVMALTGPPVPAPAVAGLEVRRIDTPQGWDDVLRLNMRCREPEFHAEESFESFRRKALARYQAMAAAGKGHWWGAYLDGQLVADMGLYYHDDVGRFQHVETDPDFRRRGICRALLTAVADRARADRLIIISLADDPAQRVYASAGFEVVERQAGMVWWPEFSSKSATAT
jgi:ribosomal protein S18 acetylase RimI-like enzyme